MGGQEQIEEQTGRPGVSSRLKDFTMRSYKGSSVNEVIPREGAKVRGKLGCK